MANRYWVGSGTWDASNTTNWSTTSGGSGGASVPTASDDVYIDANSGNITIGANVVCRSLNCVDGSGGAYTGIFTHNNYTVSIGTSTPGTGNIALKMSSGMTYIYNNYISSAFVFVSTSATQQTIITNGLNMATFTFNGTGSSYIFGSDYNGTYVQIYRGTFDTGNYNFNIELFSSAVSTARTINLGSSTITLSSGWVMQTVTNLTLNAGTSVIVFNSVGQTMSINGVTLNEVRYTGGSKLTIQATNNPTITSLKVQPTDSYTAHAVLFSGSTTIGTLTTTSQGRGKRIRVSSENANSAVTLTIGTLSLQDTDFRDITAAGAANWNISSITGGSGDLGGNTGITFTTGATQYWVGGTGSISNVNKWASSSGGTGGTGRVPLAQDTLRFDANSFSSGSQVVTFDLQHFGTVNFTGATNSPSIQWTAGGNVDTVWTGYGDFTLISTVSNSGNPTIYFSNRAATTKTITLNGSTGIYQVTIRPYNSSSIYQLGSALTVNGLVVDSNGQFDTANYNITVVTTFYVSTTTFSAGSSTIAVTGNNPSFTNTPTTFNGGTSTFTLTPGTTGVLTLSLGGKTYYNFDIVTTSRTSLIDIVGSNTFSNRFSAYDNGSPTYSLRFPSGSTQTLGGTMDIHGTAGYPINIVASTSGSSFSFSKSSGSITIHDVTLKDNDAVGGASFTAIDSSIVSNVTGWGLIGGTVQVSAAYEIVIKAENLRDSFDGTNLSNKWSNWGGGRVTLNNRVIIQTQTTSGYYGISSETPNLDLRGSSIQVSLPIDPPQTYASLETEMTLNKDNNNRIFLTKYKNGSTWKLAAYKEVAGTPTNIAEVTWNYANMKWWRIRESGGTTYWDYSADGTSWTNLTSQANAFALNNLYVDLDAGNWQTEAGSAQVEFDDFNYTGTVTSLTKSAAYSVLSLHNVTKAAAYAITALLGVQKTAQYYVKKLSTVGVSASYEVIATPIQKTYLAKVYSPAGTYITTWDDVTTDFNLPEEINSGGSTMSIEIPRQGDDFGEGEDVNYRNKVQIYVIDKEEPNGLLQFTGYINSYKADYKEDKVTIDLYSYGAELSSIVMEDGSGNTTIAYNSYDPSDIIKAILDDYAGEITYDVDSIDDTGTTVSYTFNTNTMKEGFDKVLELAPANWYYYIDQATNIFHFHEKSETPDHTFAIGKDIKLLSIKKDMSKVINTLYFSGGGDPVLYKKYTIPSSITTYGVRGYRYKDGRVTLEDTADIIANRVLNGSPEILVELSIIDSNLNDLGYDLESVKIGQSIRVGSSGIGPNSQYDIAEFDTSPFDYDLSNLSSIVFQVTSKKGTGDELGLTLSTTPPDITKRIQDIYRNLKLLENENNPTAPS